MSTLLYRLGRFAYRRKWSVIGAWSVLLLVAVAAALGLMKPFASATTIPGTEAQRTLDVVQAKFPTDDHLTGQIVFHAPEGESLTKGDAAKTVARTVHVAAGVADVASAQAPTAQAGTISPDGRTGIAQLTFAVQKGDKLTEATKRTLDNTVVEARRAGLTVELGGDAFTEVKVEVGGASEVAGVLIALGVLVFVFRSLRAAVIPVATALVGVAVGVLGLLSLTSLVTMDSTSIILAVMLGLAVGIDYALFVVSRHQTQVRAGMDPEESAGLATGTAGGAVVFAGATVVIALAALSVVNIPFLTVMGLGAAATVVVSVLIAVTLLPAVLGLMGRNIVTSTVPVLRRSTERAARHATARRTGRPSAGHRWAALVNRRRWAVLVVSLVGLGILAVPAADLRLGLGGTQDPDTSAAHAQRLIDDGFGPGYSGTLVVVVQGDKNSVVPAAEELSSTVKNLPGVATVSPVVPAKSGDAALISVTPTSGPETERTKKVLDEIRDARGAVEERTRTDINVTGTTAVNIDVVNKLSDALPIYCLVVMGLALVLLIVVFRAVAVPLKAALGFLLSLGGSLGALVAVFQWGWLSGLLGIKETGPVLSFLPILLVGILFGLAMDYEVFLVSRMREEYAHGQPPTEAMVRGFGHGAKVVTAAALIMIAVFGSFVFADMQVIKGMGLALGIGVLLDAFVVRMTLVPAVMAILGAKVWWLPRFLQRVLPDVDIEGERLTRELAAVVPAQRTETAPVSVSAGAADT